MNTGSTVPAGVNLRNTAAQAMSDWGSIIGTPGETRPVYIKYKIGKAWVIIENGDRDNPLMGFSSETECLDMLVKLLMMVIHIHV